MCMATVPRRERDAKVHVRAARCDIEIGRSLNTAPPGWRRTSDPLRDSFNHEHSLVEHGTVRNREEVVAALQEAGLEVARPGKEYITALDPVTVGPVAPERRAVRGCRREFLLSSTWTARSAVLAVGIHSTESARNGRNSQAVLTPFEVVG